jgi:hypothetical protein
MSTSVLTGWLKILSITCDNASNNDTMIEELADSIESFPGASNQTRCFNHIVNLVAKTVIRQFDVPRKQADDALNEAEQELLDLADGIDVEEFVTAAEWTGEEDEDNNNIEGWIDERAALTANERTDLDKSIQPVKTVLVKVRGSLADTTMHSHCWE